MTYKTATKAIQAEEVDGLELLAESATRLDEAYDSCPEYGAGCGCPCPCPCITPIEGTAIKVGSAATTYLAFSPIG